MNIVKGILFAASFGLVVSCGGGGGSGSSGDDSSPNNLGNDPDPALPQDLQSGLFTDAPVTGLRYEQGSITGYTANGQFQFDANSSEPVCFYLGEVRLGCSNGGAIVTPFDLSAPGQPAGLQSGYNITRLLNSLDTTDTPEITLPENINGARGVVNFAVSDGMFTTDELVIDLVNRYSPEGSLLSREQASTLIADNADVQAAISNLNQVLNREISEITIEWDSTLNGPGVLAHVISVSAGTPANEGHLYIEIGDDSGELYLQRTTYISASQGYVYVSWNKNGIPERVSLNGRTYGYFNYLETLMADWVNTSAYHPRKAGYLVGEGGFSDKIETGYVSDQISQDVLAITNILGTDQFAQGDMLRLASHSMFVIQNILCAGTIDGSCGSRASDALLNAVGDAGYSSQILSWVPRTLDTDICLPDLDINGLNGCGDTPNLDEFNVVMSQRVNSYSGMESPHWARIPYDIEGLDVEPLLKFGVNIEKVIDGIRLKNSMRCDSETIVYEFSDGNFYIAERSGELSCTESTQVFCYSLERHDRVSCDENGYYSVSDWPDFDADIQLAYDVVSQVKRKGVGFILNYYRSDSRGDRWYYSKDLSRYDISPEEYYQTLPGQAGSSEEQYALYVLSPREQFVPLYSSLEVVPRYIENPEEGAWPQGRFWTWGGSALYRSNTGSEITVAIGKGNYW